ncbi:unnamed protein product [Moneuplotes crassus]|uniref:PPM-type phosphatase domain-containing protein n=1 Tax=Euplotes crassus TaxID=5936 RepID=A0AAD2DC23_EUPCR|nr:unnamed protein product [Moneuplotes crassus]
MYREGLNNNENKFKGNSMCRIPPSTLKEFELRKFKKLSPQDVQAPLSYNRTSNKNALRMNNSKKKISKISDISKQTPVNHRYIGQNYNDLGQSQQLFSRTVPKNSVISSHKKPIGRLIFQPQMELDTQKWAESGFTNISQGANLSSMKNIHSNRTKIRDILRKSSCLKQQKDIELEYYAKLFTGHHTQKVKKEFSMPFLKKTQKMISRNENEFMKDRGNKVLPKNSIFDELKMPKKVISRDIYARKSKKIFVRKSRSKSVRASQVLKSMKYQSTSKLVSRCVVKNIAVESLAGFSFRNPYKINQDSYVICQDLLEDPESIDPTSLIYEQEQTHLFCVCDGHGDDGKSVSEYIKFNFPSNICKYFDRGILSIPEIIEKAVTLTDKLIKKTKVDDYHSGSTLTGILMKGRSFFPFNVGDSRSVLIKFKTITDRLNYDQEVIKNRPNGLQRKEHKLYREGSGDICVDDNYSQNSDKISESCIKHPECKFEVQALTNDHNCEEKREARRIYQNGGRIEQNKPGSGLEGVGPLRVWFKNEDKPGLAMTRSIGDHQARDIGVIATPEIGDKHTISGLDYGVLIASDGIFEVLSHSKIAELLWKGRECLDKACKLICAQAKLEWKTHMGSIDDITCVIIEFAH